MRGAMAMLPSPAVPSDGRPSRRAVTEWVLDQIYAEIFSGELAAGDVLGEIELTERLGVSRTPVREALRILERDGIIQADPVNGRRLIVEFGADDLRELYTLRLALERLAHELAARTIDDESLDALERLVERMESADLSERAGRRQQYDADFAFHDLVCRSAGQARLHRMLSGLWRQSRALLEQLDAAGIYPRGDEAVTVRNDHRELLAALRGRDPRAAGAAVDRHLEARRDVLAAAVESHGGLS